MRLFHLVLIMLIALQWGTGEFGWLDMEWHFRFGYAVLALLGFRLLWGVFGSDSARFANFLRGPRTVRNYLAQSRRSDGPTAVGHNPLGGWSVVALLLCVLVQAVTGLFSSDEIALFGPFAAHISDAWVERLTDVHELNANLLLVLIALHIGGVLWHEFVKHERLTAAMVHGRKSLAADPALRFAGLWRAVAALIVASAVVWALIARFGM